MYNHYDENPLPNPTNKHPAPPTFTERSTITLAILGILLGVTLVLSNLMATKLWGIGPIIIPDPFHDFTPLLTFHIRLDGGFILFPLSYILGDILVELYGKKIANCISYCTCITNVIGCLLFRVVDLLPALPNTNNISLSAVFGLSSRIMLASTLAFILSVIVNNYIYVLLQKSTTSSQIALRAWISSFVARVIDTITFTLVAFLGEITLQDCFYQMSGSFLAGMFIETLLTPLTVITARYLHRFIHPSKYHMQ